MTASLDAALRREVEAMRGRGTFKTHRHLSTPMAATARLREAGEVLVLSSNNYLGLADHPDVIAAGKRALDDFGAGTASVRFICGTLTLHEAIEQALAGLHRTEAALTYTSCWSANTGLIPAIAGEGDALIADALNHASLIDGCRMAKAARSIYRHADMDDLAAKLSAASSARRRFIVTDGVFSMEGDLCPLPEIVALAERRDATLILDDSHGVGVMGTHGRGTAEHFGVEGRVDIVTGTLGKALGGAAGGYVAGSSALIDYLQQVSRPQLFSNALPATIAASAGEAIAVMAREPERVARLHAVTARLRDGLRQRGFAPLEGESAIVPVIVGETATAIAFSRALLAEGVFVTGFGYPVVPEGAARLRLQASAALDDARIEQALDAIARVGRKMGIVRPPGA